MVHFDFELPCRMVFGPGKVGLLGKLADQLGASRALMVSDPGVVAAGHIERARQALKQSHIQTEIFDGVRENPTTGEVVLGLKLAQSFQPDLVIGFGGGSSMDCAKAINLLYTNGGQMTDYWGRGKASQPLLPAIGVPTTAGTGSETQSYALITDPTTGRKMACGDKKALFLIAVLDPVLTLTQPTKVTALTGVDALAHALETFVTKQRNPVSMVFSREAWRLLSGSMDQVLYNPNNLEARAEMQLGACWAGLAIEHSMLGATHALANPLTSRFGLPHGQAIGLMLPHVIRFNAEQFDSRYQDLLKCTRAGSSPTCGMELADFMADLVTRAGLAPKLAECGVQRESLSPLAAEAALQWTGQYNPRPVSESEFLNLYQQAY